MKATFQLLGTPFFASLLLSRTRKPWDYGLGFHRCWGCKDGKSYRNAGSLGWKRVALCHLRCRTLDLSSQAGLYRADRLPGRFMKEPGLCFWNIASSDTLHIRMCRTLCFSGLQIGTRFNLAEIPGSAFPQQQNSFPSLPYLLCEGFLHLKMDSM